MKALDVANFFIVVGSLDEGSEMTNARINKLLYFAQGWHLAMFGEELFDEDFEAWTYGPVIKDIYQRFKSCNRNAIIDTSGEFEMEDLNNETVEFLTSVYCEYMDSSTSALINMTHEKGSPWSEVYVENESNVIPKELIHSYFGTLPKIKTLDDAIKNMPTIGYINEEGVTVLPNEYNS